MDIWDIALLLLTSALGFVFFIIKSLHARINQAPSRDEVIWIVDTKLESHVTLQNELKEDIKRLEMKLDYLADLLQKRDR